MIFKAILSSKAHPELGQATIPLPIPDSEYDHTIDLLEPMGIGSPTAQDCRVEGLDSEYPILNRLTAQSVNVDELDYLAKRLDSFCQGENKKFQAMASKLHLSNIKDFINLTFCCQQATVITDFSDLECIGKDHALAVNGGGMPADAFEKVDGLSVALGLIQSGAGTVTSYGMVYSNGMELEQVYDGRHFPAFYYEDCMAAVALSLPGQDGQEMLYFPCPDSKIARAVQRLGVSTPAGCEAVLDDTDICDAVLGLFEDEFQLNEHLDTLNRLARCYQGFQDDDLEKFHTVFDYAWPQTPEEAVYLAENLREFTVINGISTAGEYGQIIADNMGLSPGVLEFLDVQGLGQRRIDEEGGQFGDRGYVTYNGSLPEIKEILGRRIQPIQESQMGGLLDELKATDTERFILNAVLQGYGTLDQLGRRTKTKIENLLGHYVKQVTINKRDYDRILSQANSYRTASVQFEATTINQPPQREAEAPDWLQEAEEARTVQGSEIMKFAAERPPQTPINNGPQAEPLKTE